MRNNLPSQTWKPRLGRARTCPPARWRPPRRPRPAGYPQGPQSRLPPAPPLAVAHRRGVCLASEHGGSHLPADTSDQLSWSPRGPYDGDGFYAGLSGPPAGPGAGHAIRQRRPRRPGASALLPIRRPRPPFRAAPRRALGLGEAPGARPSGPGTGGGSRSTRRLCVGLTVQRPVSESHRKSHLRAPEGEGPESP